MEASGDTRLNELSKFLQVVLEVAPETLYNEIFIKVFRNSLFDLSSHDCANFVVQALISHARSQVHVSFIFQKHTDTKFVSGDLEQTPHFK